MTGNGVRTRGWAGAASPGRQRGVGLIEILVAVLVLSIGLLGSVATQLTGIRGSQGAMHTTQANLLAYDAVERMRLNAAALGAGAYEIGYGEQVADVPVCTGAAASCSAQEMAAHDLWRWKQSVADLLPGGDGRVETRPTAAGVSIRIGLQWGRDARAQASNEEFIYETEIASP